MAAKEPHYEHGFNVPHQVHVYGGGSRIQFIEPELTDNGELLWRFATTGKGFIEIARDNGPEAYVSLQYPLGEFDFVYGCDGHLENVAFDSLLVLNTWIKNFGDEVKDTWPKDLLKLSHQSDQLDISVSPIEKLLEVNILQRGPLGNAIVPEVTELIDDPDIDSASIQFSDPTTNILTQYEQSFDEARISIVVPEKLVIEVKIARTIPSMDGFFAHPTELDATKQLNQVVRSIRFMYPDNTR